jgi:hypothetical protein
MGVVGTCAASANLELLVPLGELFRFGGVDLVEELGDYAIEDLDGLGARLRLLIYSG